MYGCHVEQQAGEQAMKREELVTHISEKYGLEPEHPFHRDENSCVFQHSNNQRWFALLMEIPYQALGIIKSGKVDILTLRCDTSKVSSLCSRTGIYPAYLMEKDKWITILLDDTIGQEELVSMIEASYELTRSRALRKRTIPKHVLRKREPEE